MHYTLRPISTFPGDKTPDDERKHSSFGASYSDTLTLLDRELKMLSASNVVMECDVREQDIRLDGMLRANAKNLSPTIVMSFDSKHGPLRYGCDRFLNWQDNVRAVALGLEALRKVERYGISRRGEQYQGWVQLTTGGPSKTPRQVLFYLAGVEDDGLENLAPVYREAVRRTHPDNGGSAAAFNEVQQAWKALKASQ